VVFATFQPSVPVLVARVIGFFSFPASPSLKMFCKSSPVFGAFCDGVVGAAGKTILPRDDGLHRRRRGIPLPNGPKSG
jgi:hypothetical protein